MVHLSSTRLNALEAGRHIIGKPIVLLVDVKTAEENGNEIMKAGTTVYLSKQISGDFLKKLPDST
jgi:RNA:NAD 2'-phosphotransferase (TPT1/KptA family)